MIKITFRGLLKTNMLQGLKYRFTIEGTIYERKALLKFLRPFIYHNPITLEAIGLWEARTRDFFEVCLHPEEQRLLIK